MEDFGTRAILHRHLAITRRIRALDHRRDSAEFAEGRLRDYRERIKDLLKLRDQSPEFIPTLDGMITVSLKLLHLKREQFSLPVLHDNEPGMDFDEGGAGVPSPIGLGPFTLTGAGGRLFSESEECHDW